MNWGVAVFELGKICGIRNSVAEASGFWFCLVRTITPRLALLRRPMEPTATVTISRIPTRNRSSASWQLAPPPWGLGGVPGPPRGRPPTSSPGTSPERSSPVPTPPSPTSSSSRSCVINQPPFCGSLNSQLVDVPFGSLFSGSRLVSPAF